MDARVFDVVIGLASFAVLVVLLAVLPILMSPGPAYLLAIIGFAIFLSGAGFRVNEKIT